MAFDDTEIEMKFPVTAEQFEKLRAAVAASGVLRGETGQCDEYFVPVDGSYLAQEYPYEWLSIRQRGDRVLLNYKHFYPEGAERHSHCDEIELPVGDMSKAGKLLEALGFTRAVTVRKQRVVYTISDDHEVALDSVDELGHFVEIEALRDMGGVSETRRSVAELARTLGLDVQAADPRGYPYQLLRKKGLV
jgi:predicted adenylyl cyclase CyaB